MFRWSWFIRWWWRCSRSKYFIHKRSKIVHIRSSKYNSCSLIVHRMNMQRFFICYSSDYINNDFTWSRINPKKRGNCQQWMCTEGKRERERSDSFTWSVVLVAVIDWSDSSANDDFVWIVHWRWHSDRTCPWVSHVLTDRVNL